MYEGLPIVTNKITEKGRKSIPHHLLGTVKLHEEPWKVGRFVRTATRVIQEIRSRGKLPILVGGTHYYVQSLIFEAAFIENKELEHIPSNIQEEKWPILGASTEEMMAELRRVDPATASRWHPTDRRKIRHSLALWLQTGQTPTQLYEEQQNQIAMDRRDEIYTSNVVEMGTTDREATVAPSLRFDALILWIHCDLAELSARLNKRVDSMIQSGLLQEVQAMHSALGAQESQGHVVDQSRGIWVAIGYKELIPFLLASQELGGSTQEIETLRKEGIKLTRIATRQYARRQIGWIRGRLLRALQAAGMAQRMVLLEGSDFCKWSQNVETIAKDTVSTFLEGGEPAAATGTFSEEASRLLVAKPREDRRARECAICKMTLMTEEQWKLHLGSKKHRRLARPQIDWRSLYPNTRRKNSPFPAEESYA